MKLVIAFYAVAAFGQVGEFDKQTDIGPGKPGSAVFADGRYTLTGSGANMWAAADAFHFVSKQMTGDIDISADIALAESKGNNHRKAGLMIRATADPDSPYVDVVLHGDGLISLQYRQQKGGITVGVPATAKGARRLRLVRRLDQFTMYIGDETAVPVQVAMRDPVMVGLAMCSHDAAAVETGTFTAVKIVREPRRQVRSHVSIYDLASKSVSVVYSSDKSVEAPNWTPDGKYLLVNTGGELFRLPLGAKPVTPEKVNIGEVKGANNDHGITRDGKTLAISARGPAGGSQVYIANADGSGAPRLMTPKAPSYFHGFSPDGKWFAYTAQRDGEFDVYRMPVAGGEEQRLTTAKGLDDGPDYSVDGKWIYVNSDRTGNFDIWRFPSDGSGEKDVKAQQVTSDEWEDWFPHPSPDGKKMVFISFEKGTKGHPAQRNVVLRMMPMPGDELKPGKIETIVKLFGGQGSMNVNSWSPDSRRFAYVSYELMADKN